MVDPLVTRSLLWRAELDVCDLRCDLDLRETCSSRESVAGVSASHSGPGHLEIPDVRVRFSPDCLLPRLSNTWLVRLGHSARTGKYGLPPYSEDLVSGHLRVESLVLEYRKSIDVQIFFFILYGKI